MSETLTIKNVNESYIYVDCSDGVALELKEYFSFRPDGYQFMPAYKNKFWNGYIYLFNVVNRQCLRGLAPRIEEWAWNNGYDSEYPGKHETPFTKKEALDFITKVNPKHVPRDYQFDGFVHAIQSNRTLILNPTGSGKSLLIYLLFLYLNSLGKRGLLIVPRTNLVEQMYTDFEDYSCRNNLDMSKYCHRIYQGKDKQTTLPLVISTWQSLQKLHPSYFHSFDYVILDEAHMAVENNSSQKVVTKIISNCINAAYRIGLTGTIPDANSAQLSLEALFGGIYKPITTAELMYRKQLAELSIKCILLEHSKEDRKLIKKAKYKDEIGFIIGHKGRNNFIANLVLSLKGNTLLLFSYVEKHGKVLYELLNKKGPGRKIYYIHGGTEIEERERIRRIIETETEAIIVGSIGVLSTGSNIVRLNNIVFGSPSKSKIRVLQSIGRSLRIGDDKSTATLFDIADSLESGGYRNYTYNHFLERVRFYGKEKFNFKIFSIKIK